MMVAGKDDPVGFTDSDPASSFECLCSFVDEQ